MSELTPLGNNYRSHSGLLKVAAGVVELLLHFFPSSIDPLDPDQGLFLCVCVLAHLRVHVVVCVFECV